MSEAEIRADRDRLRAQHAIRIHKLAAQAETARIEVARRKVDINRRDAEIGELKRTLADLNNKLDAGNNARRVLEHTIMDRVPRVEKRLAEARDVLSQRDQQIAELQSESRKAFNTLDESMQINQQQRLEIDRLQSSLATQHSRLVMNRAKPVAYTSDISLNSELEALRARGREQAAMISKLQSMLQETMDAESGEAVGKQKIALNDDLKQLDAGMQSAQDILQSIAGPQTEEVEKNTEEMTALKVKVETQDVEIKKLRASLDVFEEGEEAQKAFSLRDTRLALKVRLASLEKETDQQAQTIRKLRAELASINDRSARQAAFHMNELRRLGVGTFPTSVSARQRAEARNRAEQEHVKRRKSLADRITEAVPGTSADLARTPRHSKAAKSSEPALLFSKNNKSSPSVNKAALISKKEQVQKKTQPEDDAAAPHAEKAERVETKHENSNDKPAKRRALLDRIAGSGKTS